MQAYFKSYSEAVQYALQETEGTTASGLTVDQDSWDFQITSGARKPAVGETIVKDINLLRNGEEVNDILRIIIHRLHSGSFELTFYVSGFRKNDTTGRPNRYDTIKNPHAWKN